MGRKLELKGNVVGVLLEFKERREESGVERGKSGRKWELEGKELKCGKWERNGKEGREKASGDKVWEEKWELEGKRKEGKEQGGKLRMLTVRIRWLDRYTPNAQETENTVEA